MKRPAGSKNPERKGYGGVTKAVGKAVKAVGRAAYFVSGMPMFDNQAVQGDPKKVSPNSTKKAIKKPKNKF